jgi:hypothetical protein
MARYREGALALPQVRTDVDATVKRIIVDWGAGENDADDDGDGGPGDDDAGGGGPGNDNSPDAPGSAGGRAAATPGAAAASPPLRRGRLNNGNPSGDYLAAPRCGAKTRAGCACRQPAMKNGRCRLHGGKSTGARTAAGLRRARTARLVHGRRTAAVIGLRSAAAAVNRRLAWMTELASQLSAGRALSAGHGVGRSDLPQPVRGSAFGRAGGWAAAAGWPPVAPRADRERRCPPPIRTSRKTSSDRPAGASSTSGT